MKLYRDSFPSAGRFNPTDQSMTAVDPETGERLFFRDFTTMAAYSEGICLLEPEWLDTYLMKAA